MKLLEVITMQNFKVLSWIHNTFKTCFVYRPHMKKLKPICRFDIITMQHFKPIYCCCSSSSSVFRRRRRRRRRRLLLLVLWLLQALLFWNVSQVVVLVVMVVVSLPVSLHTDKLTNTKDPTRLFLTSTLPPPPPPYSPHSPSLISHLASVDVKQYVYLLFLIPALLWFCSTLRSDRFSSSLALCVSLLH